MTEIEARRILDEHRTECPRFFRGRQLYEVRKDGRVDIWRTSTKQATFELTVDATHCTIPRDVKQILGVTA